MSLFEDDLRQTEAELERTKRAGKWIKIFTLGLINYSDKINSAKVKVDRCQKELNEYNNLVKKAKILDEQLLETINFEGVRISKNTFADFPVIGGEGYPPNWENLREIVLSRDGFECQENDGYCDGPLQIHHQIPLSKGGNNHLENLITLCLYHHCQKHNHMMEKYYGNFRG